ncbi:hypothetical protein Tco_0615838 [Tanacetum coccineum]
MITQSEFTGKMRRYAAKGTIGRCAWLRQSLRVLCTAPAEERGTNGTACHVELESCGCCGRQGKLPLGLVKVLGGFRVRRGAVTLTVLSTIAERRWLISHGLRLAAMSTLESQEVRQSFGDVVKCALARGKAEAVEELHERRLLTVPAAQVPGYNQKAYEELVAAMEAMKLLELPHIAQLEPSDLDYPYWCVKWTGYLSLTVLVDILNPFATEKEVPLLVSLEAHALKVA